MGPKFSISLLLAISIVLGFLRYDGKTVGSADVIQLRFWNGFTGPDGRVMLQMIRDFNNANPDVNVTMQRIEWATYYNKLMVAALDHRAPEVFVIHASTLPRMKAADFISNVDEAYTNGISQEDFEPYVLDQVKFDGHPIGLPLDIHPQGLYCDTDLLKAAGIVGPDGNARAPRNKEEFVAALKAATVDPTHSGNPETWGYALTMWRLNFMSLIPQFGGRYFDANGKCALDCPENIAALEFLASLNRDHLVPNPENGLGWVGFRQKRVAMVWDGIYMLGDLQRLDDIHYIGAPVPQIGPKPGTLADSHVMCVRNELDEKTRSAALRLIHFISDHSLRWAGAGQVPARRSIRALPEFQKMQVQYAFSQQVPYVMFPPRSPQLFEMQLELDVAVEKAFRGRETSAQALHEANTNFQAFVDRAQLGEKEQH